MKGENQMKETEILFSDLFECFEPKENISRKDFQEKTHWGLHFTYTHNKSVLKIFEDNPWKTKDHTPYPLYAKYKPTTPVNMVVITDIFAWVLKSMAIDNLAFCMPPSVPIIKFRPTTLVTSSNNGKS